MHGSLKNHIPDQDGGEAFEVISGPVSSGILVIADHASNHIPAEFAALGMPEAELQRHIAYDIGVEWMTRALAKSLSAPAVLSRFSRLLIDPNRGDDDPTLVMRLSDGAIVPGNARIGDEQIKERMRRFSLPYHTAVAHILDEMQAASLTPAVISLHSFTPCLKSQHLPSQNRPWQNRPWDVTILWDSDPRLPLPLLRSLRGDPSLIVGDNEPYDGAMVGSTTARHCISRGIPHILFEVRQDLITNETDAKAWGHRLAQHLLPALNDPAIRQITFYGSRATGANADKKKVLS